MILDAKTFRVACAILDKNLTEMAESLGVSRVTTSRWARGKNEIPLMAEIAVTKMLDDAGRSDAHAGALKD